MQMRRPSESERGPERSPVCGAKIRQTYLPGTTTDANKVFCIIFFVLSCNECGELIFLCKILRTFFYLLRKVTWSLVIHHHLVHEPMCCYVPPPPPRIKSVCYSGSIRNPVENIKCECSGLVSRGMWGVKQPAGQLWWSRLLKGMKRGVRASHPTTCELLVQVVTCCLDERKPTVVSCQPPPPYLRPVQQVHSSDVRTQESAEEREKGSPKGAVLFISPEHRVISEIAARDFDRLQISPSCLQSLSHFVTRSPV